MRKELKGAADSANQNVALINELTTWSNQLETNLAAINMKLVKIKDELAKAKSESEVITLKCIHAFLRDCVSAHELHEMKDLHLNARAMRLKEPENINAISSRSVRRCINAELMFISMSKRYISL